MKAMQFLIMAVVACGVTSLRMKIHEEDPTINVEEIEMPQNTLPPLVSGSNQFITGYCPPSRLLHSKISREREACKKQLHFKDSEEGHQALESMRQYYAEHVHSIPEYIHTLMVLTDEHLQHITNEDLSLLTNYVKYPGMYRMHHFPEHPQAVAFMLPDVYFNRLDFLGEHPIEAKESIGGITYDAWFLHPWVMKGKHFDHKQDSSHPKSNLTMNFFNDTETVRALLEKANVSSRDVHQPRQADKWRSPHPQPEEVLKSVQTIMQESGLKYYTTLLDLQSTDVDFLKAVKASLLAQINSHHRLRNINQPGGDTVKMYFHFPTSFNTSTLHLHIRVNQGVHPIEDRFAHYLDDIIDWLETHENLYSYLLQRQENPTPHPGQTAGVGCWAQWPGLSEDLTVFTQKLHESDSPKSEQKVFWQDYTSLPYSLYFNDKAMNICSEGEAPQLSNIFHDTGHLYDFHPW
eukprot:gnl/MRDRNA2_/MRDRNA2_85484_c0_seq2.p1 gnl/MRDRNA2_/MRDRNA2_85484_c0~~gnl/MRDRNA2_/MRDRNA2_85484_c0_seq2.p1  ORF type:complete len:462 (-),score=61.18 gnl/MRDRNA2_/MRDRNA2_85484_c0_seq2:117-1502(-)